MRTRFLRVPHGRPHVAALAIVAAVIALLLTIPAGADAAVADEGIDEFPFMQPDEETFQEWVRAYESAPRMETTHRAAAAPGEGTSVDLLPHLDYVPSERSQGWCGNCWAWAGTGCMEIALDVQEDIFERLSLQYINSCQYDVIGKSCCRGGWLSSVADFYDATGLCVPWSNTNAYWQDGDGSCNTACGSVATEPHYEVLSIDDLTVATHSTEGVPDDEAAAASIRSALDQGRAVWFAFFVPTPSAWSTFTSYWLSQSEDAVIDLDAVCSGTSRYVGHAVLCVGYNDEDPENRYWVMLNSWGTASGGRPNGLFRVNMDMDYDCTCGGYSFYWQTLDVSFGLLPDIEVDPSSLSCTVLPNQSVEMNFSISNNLEVPLEYGIVDRMEEMDCPWLSENPESGTVAPGGSEDISVTVDATGLAPGEQGASVLVCSNDPDSNTVTLPVSVTVLPPADLVPAILCAEWDDAWAGSYIITLAITNDASGEAGVSTAKLFIDGEEAAEYAVPSLGPGESFSAQFGSVTLSDDSDNLSLEVDTNDEVSPEGNEDNNELSQTVEAPEVAQVQLTLHQGWNMVSVPLLLEDDAASFVFACAHAVYTWDPVVKSYVAPQTIEPGVAYWVAATEETIVPLEGLSVTERVYELTPGWHMFGSVQGAIVDFSNPKDAPPGGVEGFAYRWDPFLQSYVLETSLEEGEGYWVTAASECLVQLP